VGGFLRKEVPTRAQERETPTSTVCACATAAAAILYAGERCWGQAMLLLYMAELGGERYFSSWPPSVPANRPSRRRKEGGRGVGAIRRDSPAENQHPTHTHTHTHTQSVS
jgi:hypothetical protein